MECVLGRGRGGVGGVEVNVCIVRRVYVCVVSMCVLKFARES